MDDDKPTYKELVDKLEFAARALKDADYQCSAANIERLLTRCRQGEENNNG
jgi:hypothetical protein